VGVAGQGESVRRSGRQHRVIDAGMIEVIDEHLPGHGGGATPARAFEDAGRDSEALDDRLSAERPELIRGAHRVTRMAGSRWRGKQS